MRIIEQRRTRDSAAARVLVVCVFLGICGGPVTTSAASAPPGAPMEAVQFANEWPAPNGDLYNTRVAHTTISAANVAQLRVAWTLPLTATGANGADVANPVLADGIAYLQDNASNVAAVRYATGQVLWTHLYHSTGAGPNGVTLADGRVYGATDVGVFALDATTGEQVWYDTQLGTNAHFDIAPQVAGGKVFVSSAVTVGGGIIYALDARTGTVIWSFQTLADPVGQQLKRPAGGAWDPVLIGPDHSIYAGIGNIYLSQQQAQATPSRELYTDSIVKLDQDDGRAGMVLPSLPQRLPRLGPADLAHLYRGSRASGGAGRWQSGLRLRLRSR